MQTVEDILLAAWVEAVIAPIVQNVEVQKIEHVPAGVDPSGRLVYDTFIDVALMPRTVAKWITIKGEVSCPEGSP